MVISLSALSKMQPGGWAKIDPEVRFEETSDLIEQLFHDVGAASDDLNAFMESVEGNRRYVRPELKPIDIESKLSAPSSGEQFLKFVRNY